MVCPQGPAAYADNSTTTRASSLDRPQGWAALGAPWGPSNCTAPTPWEAV